MEARAIRTATSFSTTSPSADATPNSGHGGQRRTVVDVGSLNGTCVNRQPVDAATRDPELNRLGLDRDEVIASPAEHYPCTRRLAVEGLARTLTEGALQGFIWHSRQAELAGEEPAEVIVLFGDPRYPSGRGTWSLARPGLTALYEGPGRLLVDQIAEQLRAVVETVQKVALRAARGVPSTDLVWDQSWSVNSPKCPGVMNCARASR